MAAVIRRFDDNRNRCVDTFPGGRSYLFFKAAFGDHASPLRFIVVREANETASLVLNPGAPGINADWDEHIRIDAEGDFDHLITFTVPQRKMFNLVMWWGWIMQRRMNKVFTDMTGAGLTLAEVRRGLFGTMIGMGIPSATAVGLAQGVSVANDIALIKYTDLGLTDIPTFWKRIIRAGAD